MKECVICHTKFKARGSQTVCSEECRAVRDRRYDKEYKRVLRQPGNYRICTVCGKKFLSFAGMQVCSEECHKKRYEQRKINKRIKPTLKIKTCIICGKEFTTYYEHQKCCSEKCQKQRKVDIAVAHNKKVRHLEEPKLKHCKYCGELFMGHKNKYYCSSYCRNKEKTIRYKEKLREIRKEYYKKNREKILAKAKMRYKSKKTQL